MRSLDDLTCATISAIDRERTIPISPAMLEKDILVRDAILAIKAAGQREGCQLVFAGGTALSQAHQLIERMSEDADFRIVVPDGLSNGQTRKLLSAVKTEIERLLADAGFPLVGEMKGRNNNSYMMGRFAYQSRFSNNDDAMREHLKLEITAFAPISAVSELRLATIVDRVTGEVSSEDTIPTVSIMDTLADKMVGYLRRTAQERAGLTRGDYDDRLVRHLYDTHCVVTRLSSSPDFHGAQFAHHLIGLAALTVERDVATYGNQYEEFADDPHAVLRAELAHLGDDDVRTRYRRFCQTMIWGGRLQTSMKSAGPLAAWQKLRYSVRT
ncbi:MAG: nucleotidyl transferase AbiEii/AbiGii toxin family protein [Actinomycetota bacterium]|nr:nucleotidyl transferase AbiEii/AbiGii toxin family protein [Actinomycetota bacterium]